MIDPLKSVVLTLCSFFSLLIVFKPFGILLVDLEVLSNVCTTSLTVRTIRAVVAQ